MQLFDIDVEALLVSKKFVQFCACFQIQSPPAQIWNIWMQFSDGCFSCHFSALPVFYNIFYLLYLRLKAGGLDEDCPNPLVLEDLQIRKFGPWRLSGMAELSKKCRVFPKWLPFFWDWGWSGWEVFITLFLLFLTIAGERPGVLWQNLDEILGNQPLARAPKWTFLDWCSTPSFWDPPKCKFSGCAVLFCWCSLPECRPDTPTPINPFLSIFWEEFPSDFETGNGERTDQMGPPPIGKTFDLPACRGKVLQCLPLQMKIGVFQTYIYGQRDFR